KLDVPNQLWVADITYVTIATGFVYLAAILDAWSRRVVGYAISRSIDARLAVAALKAAISARNPPRGCAHHSDRGSQYASEDYRAVLQKHGLTGSMGRRGNHGFEFGGIVNRCRDRLHCKRSGGGLQRLQVIFGICRCCGVEQ